MGSILRAAMRRYPLLSGCGTLSNGAVFRAAGKALPSPMLTRTKSGAAIWVQPEDYVGRAVHFAGDLDAKVSWICRNVLQPGDTVLDIGGNIGLITMQCAQYTAPNGSVHAFEPQPDLAQMIERSAAENGFKHVRVHAVALSNEDGEAAMVVPQGNRGQATMEGGHEGAGERFSIAVRHAGRYLASLGLGPLRLIKIDVEGHEATLLEGASEYLSEHPADFILFELNRAGTGFWSSPTVTTIREWGYDFYEIPKCYVRMRLRGVQEGDGYVPGGHDYLAVRRGAEVPETVRRAFVTG